MLKIASLGLMVWFVVFRPIISMGEILAIHLLQWVKFLCKILSVKDCAYTEIYQTVGI